MKTVIKNFSTEENDRLVKYVRLSSNPKIWRKEMYSNGERLAIEQSFEVEFTAKNVTRKEVLQAFA